MGEVVVVSAWWCEDGVRGGFWVAWGSNGGVFLLLSVDGVRNRRLTRVLGDVCKRHDGVK